MNSINDSIKLRILQLLVSEKINSAVFVVALEEKENEYQYYCISTDELKSETLLNIGKKIMQQVIIDSLDTNDYEDDDDDI